MIITEIQHFFSKIIRFQATFKGTVEFTCALEFKISSQLFLIIKKINKIQKMALTNTYLFAIISKSHVSGNI